MSSSGVGGISEAFAKGTFVPISSALALAADQRAVLTTGASWDSGHTFADTTKDGIFYVEGFADAADGAGNSTKLFGGRVTKTGTSNHDAHWASIDHQGSGQTGLFIGDVTANAAGLGGDVWGGHFVLNLDKAVNAYGHRVEFTPSVSQAGKVQYGVGIANTNDSVALTQGLRVRGNFTSPIIVYSDAAGTAQIFQVDHAGAVTTGSSLTVGGTVSATGQVQSTTSTDGATLFRMNTDRPWSFKQVGTAGGTALRLCPDASAKVFRITAPTSNRAFEVNVDDTVANSYCWVMPESGGKVGFYGKTPIAQAVLATGASHTVDDVITALQSLGLVKQA